MISALALAAAVVLLQAAAGAVIWMWARRTGTVSLIEVTGMGLALGTLLALVGSQVTVSLGGITLGWLLPLAIAVLLWTGARLDRVSLARIESGSQPHWVAAVVVMVIGLLTLIPGFQRTPLSDGYVTGNRYHGDLVFFEAVAQFLSRLGPSDSTLLPGFGIRYHWFSYGWIGSVTEVTDAAPFVVMTRVFPVVAVVGASFLSVAWAARLSTRKWTPLLAGLLVVVAGFVGAAQGVILNFDSPSTSYATVLALAFGVAFTSFFNDWRHGVAGGWPTVLVLGALSVGMVGAKASQAFVVAVGLIVVGLVYSRSSSGIRSRAWVVASTCGWAMLVTYWIVISGVAPSSTNVAFDLAGEKVSTFQGLDPFEGLVGGMLGSTALLLAIIPRWLGGVWLVGARETRWSPEAAFGIGVAAAGVFPLFLLSSGTNAGWFAVAASALLSVLAASGLERAWDHVSGSLPRFMAAAVIGALLVNAGVFVAYALATVSGASVLWRGPVVAWLIAAVTAVGVLWWSKATHINWISWLAALSTILVFSSVGARFNGPVLWDSTEQRLSPLVQDFIRWTDPDAQFPEKAPSDSSLAAGTLSDIRASGNPDELLQWSKQLNDAAFWLKGQVEEGTYVALDVTYLQPFLPVVTNLSMYVAGEPYMSGYTTVAGAEAAMLRQAEVAAFLDGPSLSTAQALWSADVRWLWLQMTPPSRLSALDPWATPALTNEYVTVLRLNDPDANSE